MPFPAQKSRGLMTRPSNSEKCKNCGRKFIPPIDIESLPVFNSIDKSGWNDTNCPNCGFVFKVARLSRNSHEVCLIPSKKSAPRESRGKEAVE